MVFVQVFRGVEIDLPERFGPVVFGILLDVTLHEVLCGFPRGGGKGAIEGVGPAFLLAVAHGCEKKDAAVAFDIVEHFERAVELGKMGIDVFGQLRRNLLAELFEHVTLFIKRLKRASDDWRRPV